jgi:protein involved in polysaccharide export with SLBB domain
MVLLLAVSLTGCAASLERDTSFNSVGQQASNGTPGNYRIGPLDVLDISVFEAPDLTKTVEVADNGMIDVNYARVAARPESEAWR